MKIFIPLQLVILIIGISAENLFNMHTRKHIQQYSPQDRLQKVINHGSPENQNEGEG